MQNIPRNTNRPLTPLEITLSTNHEMIAMITQYHSSRDALLFGLDSDLSTEIKKELQKSETSIINQITKLESDSKKIVLDAQTVYDSLHSETITNLNNELSADKSFQLVVKGEYGKYSYSSEKRTTKLWISHNLPKKIGIDAFITKMRSLGYHVEDLG